MSCVCTRHGKIEHNQLYLLKVSFIKEIRTFAKVTQNLIIKEMPTLIASVLEINFLDLVC